MHNRQRHRARAASSDAHVRLAAALVATLIAAAALLLAGPVRANPLFAAEKAGLEAQILSPADQDRYKRIFRVQETGDWATADRLIAELGDDVLMGHVLYQRYMHPTAYRSSYRELRDWLAKYADHPGADKIYKLAMTRRGGSPAPISPLRRSYRPTAYHSVYAVSGSSAEGRTPYGREIARKVRSLIYRERPTQALGLLDSAKVRNRLPQDERAALMARIAWSYYVEGKITLAYDMASDITKNHRRDAPLADWYAGLAAWRLGKPEVAAPHFEALAESVQVSNWTRAAGAYWAARTYLASREPAKAVPMLEKAAATGMTFYGLIAQRQLGRAPDVDWTAPPSDAAGRNAILAVEQVRRGAALALIGKRGMAEGELRRAHGRLDPSLDTALAALAQDLDLPATQLAVALAADTPLGTALFPVPKVEPNGGYRIDRALLFAVARQESKFITDAESRAGATGLMQIMPRTARHLMRTGGEQGRLADPAFNLALGQQYLEELMGYGEPYANLFMMAVAYNAGPGNMSRWMKQMQLGEVTGDADPLTFIESIPSAETRGYVERIMTNFWLYRMRLGQPAPSLDDAAAGKWPVYHPVERATGFEEARAH